MSVEAVAYAVPSIMQTAEDVARATGADTDFIANKVGLKTRYVLAENEGGVQLSAKACWNLLEMRPNLAAEGIDLLVCVTQNPDRRIPNNAPGIAQALGLPRSVATFDISLGCSGYVYGLEIVEGFLQRCGMRNAILTTCDPYSKIMAAEDRDTNCIFGDAATATWVKAGTNRSRTLSVDFGSDGTQGNAIEIPAGGSLLPFVSLASEAGVNAYAREQLRLHMRGRAVFNFVLSRIPQSLDNCLLKADLSRDQIDFFALHQGSIYMIEALARRAGIPDEKLLRNMSRFGNTVSSTIPLLLAELDKQDQLAGRTIFLSGFGVGLSWASSILRFEH